MIQIRKPRLRQSEGGRVQPGVEIPAYKAINGSGRLDEWVLELLMANMSTRNYARVIPDMADNVGVSRYSVIRHFVAESGKAGS